MSWVSTAPFQMGEYLSYNLEHVLKTTDITKNTVIYDSTLCIPQSPFLLTKEYSKFNKYKILRKELQNNLKSETKIDNEDEFIVGLINNNPEYYQGYVLAANYFFLTDKKEKALFYYKKALDKEFENTTTKRFVEERVKNIVESNK